ncbi:MAG: EAL domain-containing protein [Sulfuricaulis sp.]|nr:EAL domain-containing protein [Sulfuricaulis sp.]
MLTRPDAGDSLQSSLSTKISVIVFWGMILVGLLASFGMLHGREQEIATNYSVQANSLSYELDEYIDGMETFSWNDLENKVRELSVRHLAVGVSLGAEGHQFLLGEQGSKLISIKRTFAYRPKNTQGAPAHVKVVAVFNYPALQDALALERKKVLVAIGVTMLAFGLLLHWMLRKVLTRPFHHMVRTAKSITHGEMALRFEESRTDEFGFLARFINKALDFVSLKQEELQAALKKVRQSETNLLKEKSLIEVTLHSIGDAVITTDAAGNIQYFNLMAEQLTGWQLNDAHGKPVRDVLRLIDEEHRKPVDSSVESCLREGIVVGTVEHVVLVRPDGSEVDVVNTAAPIRAEHGGLLIGAVLVIHDVSRARKMAKQLSYQASHDDLTGLFNRREFERRLAKLVDSSESGNQEHTLCYMDLDQFKIVNDTCGHIAGDELLRQFTAILRGTIRDTDTVARLGGDEFGILFARCNAEVAKRIAENLLSRVKEYRFAWKEYAFDVGVSIGLVSIASGEQSVTDIMSAADVACYAAKDAGRNRVHVYHLEDSELKQRHGEMRWVSRIGKALEQDRFQLYCQKIVPVVDSKNSAPHYELLIRLLDEEGKIIPPLAFIPAAERYNLMTSIDRWVVGKAFETFSANAGIVSGWLFSINLSGQSLSEEGFLKFVIDTFDKTGVAPDRVCFEITETTAMVNLTRATQFIAVLKGMGCHFSLDDFGTGLSSFGYLKALNVDYLKIDGSFVRHIVSDPVNRAVVEAANQIGHAMGIKTVAEFVESNEIMEILRQIGVDYAQGYAVGKPHPLNELFSEADRPMAQKSAGR